MFVRRRAFHILVGMITLSFAAMICECAANAQADKSGSKHDGVIYRNPRVYNVDYSFEMVPDPNKIDRAKDLKVWLSIPREWDSQKAVKIISVEPEPHARYVDPEYGNPMLFWDFGKEPEQASYKVDVKFRLESYEVSVKVDPELVGSYDKTTKDYALYTRSTHTISITPKIREMAHEAIGDEKNPYLQAKRILAFVRKKVHFKVLDFERGRGIKCLLDYPVINEKTGEEYYEGCCSQDTALFVALCRAVGIPARSVSGYIRWCPWVKSDDLKARYPFETKISPEGLATTQFYTELDAHMWGECFIPNYGWIPTDGKIEHQNNKRWIMSKGRDIQVGPCAPQEDSDGYGAWWVALHNGRADMGMAVMNIAKIHTSKIKVLHHSAPFPVVKYSVYFLTAIILAIFVGGLAGYICLHKFNKYALIGLSSVVPFVGLALPIVLVTKEKQIRCSKVSFVMLFWIFSIFLLWLLVFPVMVETDLIPWSTWLTFCAIVICILSVLGGWILAGFFCRKSWIKNKAIRVIIKTILFGIFWIVSACMLGVWITSSFT